MPRAERGPVYVVWWPDGEPHGHQLIISTPGEKIELDWGAIEDYATELAEAVERCNEERHEGHGKTHGAESVRQAFDVAKLQLMTKDYDAEWEEFERQVRLRKLWGGPAPAAVMFYDADKNPLVAITDQKTGIPTVYRASKQAKDMIAPPDYSKAHIDPAGVGWVRKRRLRPETKLRRLKPG